ncbi:translation initiation factor 2 subunit 1 [Enteropsectra breve]|nr:translation initiation factor 2 subunit 1 [Enteropsectra breve]
MKILPLMFECRIKSKKFPEEGEIVMARTISTANNIINMALIEYGNIEGLVLNSEMSKKKIKNISQVSKIGSTEMCQVLRVEKEKGFIDLSLKKVNEKEKGECLTEFNRSKLAYQIMARVAKSVNVSISELYEDFGYSKAEEYGSLYFYFAEAKNDAAKLSGNKYGDVIKTVIEDQFKASTFKIRIDVDVSIPVNGLINIKKAFAKAKEFDPSLEVTLLKLPTYSIVKIGSDKEDSLEAVNSAAEIVRTHVEDVGGVFSIASPAQLYGEKTKHQLLNETRADNNEIEDSDE